MAPCVCIFVHSRSPEVNFDASRVSAGSPVIYFVHCQSVPLIEDTGLSPHLYADWRHLHCLLYFHVEVTLVWTSNRQFWRLVTAFFDEATVRHLQTDWETHRICLQYKQLENNRRQKTGVQVHFPAAHHMSSLWRHWTRIQRGWTESGQSDRT